MVKSLKSLISKALEKCVLALILVSWASAAHAVYCTDMSEAPVDCSDEEVFYCYENKAPDQDFPGAYIFLPDEDSSCYSAGFTVVTANEDMNPIVVRSCPDFYPGCGAAIVPELEDYAAAAFLVLALTIGWQMRQRRMSI